MALERALEKHTVRPNERIFEIGVHERWLPIRKAREQHVTAPLVDNFNEGFVQRFFLSHARDLPRAIFEHAVDRTVVPD